MIEPGKTVKVHYKSTLEDGSIFDLFEGKSPLEFQVGSGQQIPGFDAAMQTMQEGQTRTITIPSTEAFKDLTFELTVVAVA